MPVRDNKPRKKPERSCIACRTTGEKQTLIRFVRTTAGEVLCDPTGRQAGRGAYLCANQKCFTSARKKHQLDRALKIDLNEGDYQRLEEAFATQCDKVAMV